MGNIFVNFYKCVKEWYFAVWILQVFWAPDKMSSGTSTCGGSASGGSGALSLMGCVREASPPPQDHHTFGMGEFSMQKNSDTLPKGKFLFTFFFFYLLIYFLHSFPFVLVHCYTFFAIKKNV